MNEIEKENYVNELKQSIRNKYQHDVAEEMCKKLDIVKKGADSLEQLFNMCQNQFSTL